MTRPYTSQPAEALVIAGTSLAAVMTMLLWRHPPRPRAAAIPLLAAMWIAAVSPLGQSLPAVYGFDEVAWGATLRACALVGGASLFAARPFWMGGIGLLWAIGTTIAVRHVPTAWWELTAWVVTGLAVLAGLMIRATPAQRAPEPAGDAARLRPFGRDDAAIFAFATAIAAAVSIVVLERGTDSDDEWGYTFDALLFARGRVFAVAPHCPGVLRAHWIFHHLGKAVPEYTPGWPLFMTPFTAVGAAWLAGPVAHGIFAVGCARLARRAMWFARLGGAPPTEREVGRAGIAAASFAVLGASQLLNGASRFPHVFELALFVWAGEAIFRLEDLDRTARRARLLWSALLGVACVEMLAVRTIDGATLGFALFLCFAWIVVRRRFGWRDAVAAIVPGAVLALLVLRILRVQLGAWFVSGYSLAKDFYDWADPKFALPKADELHFVLPMHTWAFMFWPASLALGAVGAMHARGRGARVSGLLGVGAVLSVLPYLLVTFNRGADFGYGPRYYLGIVPFAAVGGALVVVPLMRSAAGWVAVAAIASGTIRIGALVYPETHAELHARNSVRRAVARDGIHDAVVTVVPHATALDVLDITENDPADDDPDVIYAGEGNPNEQACLRRVYAGRTFYRAEGQPEVTLKKY